jgi:hypothetical protein
MVTWPLPVIFTQTLWLRLVPKVNRRPGLSSQKPSPGRTLDRVAVNSPVQISGGCGVEWPGGVDLCPDAMHQAMTGSESEAELHSAAALREDLRKNQ